MVPFRYFLKVSLLISINSAARVFGNLYSFTKLDYPTLGTTAQVGWYIGVNDGNSTTKTCKITNITDDGDFWGIHTDIDLTANTFKYFSALPIISLLPPRKILLVDL